MKIKKNVEIPKNVGRGKLGEVSLAIMEFCESDDANIKFECGGKAEADKVSVTAYGIVRAKKLPVKVTRSGLDIYVTRKQMD